MKISRMLKVPTYRPVEVWSGGRPAWRVEVYEAGRCVRVVGPDTDQLTAFRLAAHLSAERDKALGFPLRACSGGGGR